MSNLTVGSAFFHQNPTSINTPAQTSALLQQTTCQFGGNKLQAPAIVASEPTLQASRELLLPRSMGSLGPSMVTLQQQQQQQHPKAGKPAAAAAAGEQQQGGGGDGFFRMPLHYPRYKRADYEAMPEWRVDCLLREYGLPVAGDLRSKREFAMGAFLWPDQY